MMEDIALVAVLVWLLIKWVSAPTAHQAKRPMTEEHASSKLFHVVQDKLESHKPNAKHVIHSPNQMI